MIAADASVHWFPHSFVVEARWHIDLFILVYNISYRSHNKSLSFMQSMYKYMFSEVNSNIACRSRTGIQNLLIPGSVFIFFCHMPYHISLWDLFFSFVLCSPYPSIPLLSPDTVQSTPLLVLPPPA